MSRWLSPTSQWILSITSPTLAILGLVGLLRIIFLTFELLLDQGRAEPDSITESTFTIWISATAFSFASLITLRHFRHSRAAHYIERFNSDAVRKCRETVDAWLAGYEPLPSASIEAVDAKSRFAEKVQQCRLLAALELDSELTSNLRVFANFFQELGQAYERGMVSKVYTCRMFDYLAPRYWNLLGFWVQNYRTASGNPSLYSRFEKLAESLSTCEAAPAKQARSPLPEELWLARCSFRQRAPKLFVFGYGSILNRDSAATTMGATSDVGFPLAKLKGFGRRWQALDSVVLAERGGEVAHGLFLDLVVSAHSKCNGVLVPVSEEELHQFDKREKNYARVDVSSWVQCKSIGNDYRVFAYVGMPEWTLPPSGSYEISVDVPVVRLARYEALVARGVEEQEAIHPGFAKAYSRSTDNSEPRFARFDGVYRFRDETQNRATGR